MSGRFGVLLSSAGRRVALLRILRSTLQQLGLDGAVVAADASQRSSAFHDADRGFVVPPCVDPGFPEAILAACAQAGVRLVVPTIDTELPVYARHRERFAEAGVAVAVSSPEVVAICEDKERTHAWLLAHGLPTVRQMPAGELDGLRFPLLVKPRRGSSSIGVALVRDGTELELAVRDGEFVAQSVAPGVEYSIDILADRSGACRSAVPRRRLEVRAGETSKGVTVRCERLMSVAGRLCEALPGAYGPLTVQVFLDEATGELNVIEINARFGGGFPLSWQAGAHHPKWMVEEILGRPVTAHGAWRDGLVMLRYDEGVFVDSGAAGL